MGKYICSDCGTAIDHIRVNELVCPVCEHLAIDGKTHPRCRTKYSPDGLISYFRYKGVIRTAIHAIKYRFVRDMAEELVAAISKDMTNEVFCVLPKDRIYVLVPIPLHIIRERNRGFNQAVYVGNMLSTRLDIPLRTSILRRVRYTAPQVSMTDREARIQNMQTAFSVHQGVRLLPCVVYILFDDVYTTGATLRSAARCLKREGAQHVWGMTLAR